MMMEKSVLESTRLDGSGSSQSALNHEPIVVHFP
jgi:hypothetical protein